MTNTEELRALLINALEAGFSVEDINDMAAEAQEEFSEQEQREEFIDSLQDDATTALVDFLFEIGYINPEEDYDKEWDAVNKALSLVRNGNLNVKVKGCGDGCSCSASLKSKNSKDMTVFDLFDKMF